MSESPSRSGVSLRSKLSSTLRKQSPVKGNRDSSLEAMVGSKSLSSSRRRSPLRQSRSVSREDDCRKGTVGMFPLRFSSDRTATTTTTSTDFQSHDESDTDCDEKSIVTKESYQALLPKSPTPSSSSRRFNSFIVVPKSQEGPQQSLRTSQHSQHNGPVQSPSTTTTWDETLSTSSSTKSSAKKSSLKSFIPRNNSPQRTIPDECTTIDESATIHDSEMFEDMFQTDAYAQFEREQQQLLARTRTNQPGQLSPRQRKSPRDNRYSSSVPNVTKMKWEDSCSTVSTGPSSAASSIQSSPNNSRRKFSKSVIVSPEASSPQSLKRAVPSIGERNNNSATGSPRAKSSSAFSPQDYPSASYPGIPFPSGSSHHDQQYIVQKKNSKCATRKNPKKGLSNLRKVHFAPDGITTAQNNRGLDGKLKLVTIYSFEQLPPIPEQDDSTPKFLRDKVKASRDSEIGASSAEAVRRSLLLDEYSVGGNLSVVDDNGSCDSESSVDSAMEYLERFVPETARAECRLALTRLYFAHDKEPEERDAISLEAMTQIYSLFDFLSSEDDLSPWGAAQDSKHSRGSVHRMEEHTLRGLESCLCPQVVETLRERHVESVLTIASKKGNSKQLRAASLQTSRPFRFLAYHMAKYDTHVALKAVLQSW